MNKNMLKTIAAMTDRLIIKEAKIAMEEERLYLNSWFDREPEPPYSKEICESISKMLLLEELLVLAGETVLGWKPLWLKEDEIEFIPPWKEEDGF